MKKMKKITALILAGVLCTSSLSGIPADTLLASEEGSGTSTTTFDFEDSTNPFESLNNEAETVWGIADNPLDSSDKEFKFTKSTSLTSGYSKYELKDQYLAGSSIESVSGTITFHKGMNKTVFVVAEYTDADNWHGFGISYGNNKLTIVRQRMEGGSLKATAGTHTYVSSYTDINNAEGEYYSYNQPQSSSFTLTGAAKNYLVLNYTLEYYQADASVGGGYRAKITFSQDESETTLTHLTYASGLGSTMMYALAYDVPKEIYVDDITIQLVCGHSTTKEDDDEQYLASAGDCKTHKTYYTSCVSCGGATSETFESTTFGDHKSSVTETGYDKLCDLCGTQIEAGNGTSELVNGKLIDFEKAGHRTLFESKNTEWADWGIVASPVTDDTNSALKLTSSTTAISKYQLRDQYVSGTTIQSVSGKVAIKIGDTAGLYVVTKYTEDTDDTDDVDESSSTGFWLYSDNAGELWLMRAQHPDPNGKYVLTTHNPSIWKDKYTDVYNDTQYRYSTTNLGLTTSYTWVDWKLEYYAGDSDKGGGYRAKMTLSQGGQELLTLPTVVGEFGSFLMFTTAGTNKTVYLDDITVTLQEQTCAHSNVVEVADEKYLANAGDCENYKTYYKRCADCGEAMSDTFTSDVLGNHNLTEFTAVAGDCDTAGSKAYWDCSVCEKKFYDANATQEVLKDEDLVIPAGHSWNEEEYVSDATQHWHTCSKCSTASEKQAHTWGNDATNPNKLKCTECGYVTAQDVLPMICGAKIKADTEEADATQYLRYDIDFSAMKNNAAACGLTVSEYGVIAVGTTKAVMTLEDVRALSKNNPATVKSQKVTSQEDLDKLGTSGLVTVKIKRDVKDYGRRTTIVAFMKVGDQTYYSYNKDYDSYTGIANNGIASKGVMDVMKPYLYDGKYGTDIAPDENTLTYTQKAFDNFWTEVETYVSDYEVFGIWGENPDKDTVKTTYLDNYISGAMTVPSDTGSEEYKQYQAAKQLAVCVFSKANELLASSVN